jgi:hypothetical protein
MINRIPFLLDLMDKYLNGIMAHGSQELMKEELMYQE